MGTLTGMVSGGMHSKWSYPVTNSGAWNYPDVWATTPPANWRNNTAVFRTTGIGSVAGLAPPSDEFIVGVWVSFDGALGPVGMFTGWAFDPGPPIDMTDWRACVGFEYDPGDGEVQLWSDGVGPWVGSPTLLERASASSRQHNGIFYRRQQWHHMGAWFKQTGTALAATLYIDGKQFLSYSGGANEWLTMPDVISVGLRMHTSSGWTYHMQDGFYIMDVTGEGDQIPPALRPLMTHVDGAGGSTQWTPDTAPNWSEVRDYLGSPDINDFVETAVAGNLDLYTHDGLAGVADLPYSYNIYDAILLESYFENVDDGEATQRSFEHVIDVAAVQSTDGSFSNATLNTYDIAGSIFISQPDASAWNLADYNAMEVGYNST